MDQNQLKVTVAKLLADSIPLSEIQDILKNEHDVNMTFLELRLLASELENIDWTKLNSDDDEKEDEAPEDITADSAHQRPGGAQSEGTTVDAKPVFDDQGSASSGKTVVELSKIARPGAVASGTVTFASGVTAEWVLDQLGRLGLDKPSGQPTPEDLQDFQVELQKLLAGGGM